MPPPSPSFPPPEEPNGSDPSSRRGRRGRKSTPSSRCRSSSSRSADDACVPPASADVGKNASSYCAQHGCDDPDYDRGGNSAVPHAPLHVPPDLTQARPTSATPTTAPSTPHAAPLWSFWSLGLLNNTSYVLMIATAKSISDGGTALVYLSSILPGLFVKLSAPYWFDKVGYRIRLGVASVAMVGCFVLVGWFSGRNLRWELVGVGLCSLQGSLGEASLLALAGRYDSNLGGESSTGAAGGDAAAATANACHVVNVDANDEDTAQPPPASNKGKGRCITAFSSGTGLAGVVGFGYKVLLSDWLGLTLRTSLYLANVFAVLYWWTYWTYLDCHIGSGLTDGSAADGWGGGNNGVGRDEEGSLLSHAVASGRLKSAAAGHDDDNSGDNEDDDKKESIRGVELHLLENGGGKKQKKPSSQRRRQRQRHKSRKRYDGIQTSDDLLDGTSTAVSSDTLAVVDVAVEADRIRDTWHDEFDVAEDDASSSNLSHHTMPALSDDDYYDDDDGPDINALTPLERFRLSLTLWPYMIPLFTVYAAEYALQSGTWTAIGFPVDDIRARDEFYEYSNWTYQLGVFVSRSSGTVYQAGMGVLWLMPLLQCVNLALFSVVAASHVWYDYTLLIPCFYVGLLGGAVYVNGYTRINADLPKSVREFALSTVSVADTLGIVVADVCGLFLQSCLYRKNGIDGAVVQCPF